VNITSTDRIVREAERASITGVPRATAWLQIRNGEFPKPVPLGPQARGWLLSELLAWVGARTAERDNYKPRSAEMKRRALKRRVIREKQERAE